MVSSQPVHKSDTDSDNVDSVGARGAMIVESFTQPSRFDELIIGTQIPCTPGASQVSSSKLFLVLFACNCYMIDFLSFAFLSM